jgi:hypothetical protein
MPTVGQARAFFVRSSRRNNISYLSRLTVEFGLGLLVLDRLSGFIVCAFVSILLWGTGEALLEWSVGIYSRARSVFNLGDSSPMGILGVSFETVTHCLIRFYSSYTPSMDCLRQLNSMTVGFHFITIDSRFTV